MRHKSDLWNVGIGSPGIVTISAYTRLESGTPARLALERLDNAIRDCESLASLRETLHRVGVALINTRLVETGQLFQIDSDGKVIESLVVVPELREMLAALLGS